MNRVLLASGVVSLLGNGLVFVRKCKKAARQQARLSLAFSYLSPLLLLSSLHLIAVGLSEADPRLIARAFLRLSYLVALAMMALGMALPIRLIPSARKDQRRPLSGKEFLGIVLYVLMMLVFEAHRAYKSGNLTLFSILSFWGGVIFAFGLFPFLRKLKATWKRPRRSTGSPFCSAYPSS